MNFKPTFLDVDTSYPIVFLNFEDAQKLGIESNDQVVLKIRRMKVRSFIALTKKLVNKGSVGVGNYLRKRYSFEENLLNIARAKSAKSFNYIRKKMQGGKLSYTELREVIQDAVNGNLTNLEMAAFILAEEYVGMTMEEIEHLTKVMVETGETIEFNRTVYDKHSIGGVPGNKISLLIVPTIAAAGLFIPKTSSKAITSPSGTADTMSVLAPVEFTPEEFKEVALKAGGAIVWGGRLGLAPADDIFIREVERPLRVDPESQMLASIFSKKLATGVNYLTLDLPVGEGAKIENRKNALELAHKFSQLGHRLGIKVVCGITYGGQPIGRCVGPALEAKEALEALINGGKNCSTSLLEKSMSLAGLLLEVSGKSRRGYGKDLAYEIFRKGRAYLKMKEIIEAQGGDPDIKPEDLPVGQHKAVLKSPIDGYIKKVDNEKINEIARKAGAPKERGAGLVIYGKQGHKVKKGEPILEIFAERTTKLNDAYELALTLKPIAIEGMLLDIFPEITT